MENKSMITKIKLRLGANYQENTDYVISDILDDMISIADDVSNRQDINKLFPYIKKAVVSEYLKRGAEGLLSRNEGSVSSSFYDIEEKLRNDIIKNNLRRLI